jgi:hypothetical protein
MQKTSVVIAVETPVTRFEIAVPYAVTGQQIFDEVVAALGVEETWWFGLSGTDFDGQKVWVKNKKKLGIQVPFNTEPVELSFDVKIYPQRVEGFVSRKFDTIILYSEFLNIKKILSRTSLSAFFTSIQRTRFCLASLTLT